MKHKAISGASWSLAGRFLQQGSQFVFGIILARLLLPDEYGLVAMAMVFIAVFQVFVDAGFGVAIVQRKRLTNSDLSTVFYLNLGVSILAYIILYFSAGWIAEFYNEPQLIKIIRVLSLLVILIALAIVQNALITREVNFKFRTRMDFTSQVLSSGIAIIMAYHGYGVWALIWKSLINQVLVNLQLWKKNNWFPAWEFSKNSFKYLFSFGSKLLLSGLLNQIYLQIYKLIVGKFYPAAELGFYSRADQFKNLPSHTISNSLLSFLLPVFSKMQDQPERLKKAALKVIKIVMFFNINAMIVMGIVAEPMINVLLGEKWAGVIPYLQLLVLVGVFYPLHAINVQILTSFGRSDLFLRIEVLKKFIAIPTILLAIFVGIKAMIVGMIVTSLLALSINTYYTKKLIDLGLFEQLKSIIKSCWIACVLVLSLFPAVYYLKDQIHQIVLLISVLLLAFVIVLILSRAMKMEEYDELKEIIINLRKKYGKKRKYICQPARSS